MDGTFSSSESSDFVPSFLDHLDFKFQMSGENFQSIVLDFDHPEFQCIYRVRKPFHHYFNYLLIDLTVNKNS